MIARENAACRQQLDSKKTDAASLLACQAGSGPADPRTGAVACSVRLRPEPMARGEPKSPRAVRPTLANQRPHLLEVGSHLYFREPKSASCLLAVQGPYSGLLSNYQADEERHTARGTVDDEEGDIHETARTRGARDCEDALMVGGY